MNGDKYVWSTIQICVYLRESVVNYSQHPAPIV